MDIAQNSGEELELGSYLRRIAPNANLSAPRLHRNAMSVTTLQKLRRPCWEQRKATASIGAAAPLEPLSVAAAAQGCVESHSETTARGHHWPANIHTSI